MAKHRDKLCELLEEGFDPLQMARDLLGYLSDADCKDFAEKNDIELFPEEDEPEFEYDDEDDVNEAFAELWEQCVSENPRLKNDKPAKRESFTQFVDQLHRAGKISDELSADVTLEDDD